MGPRQEGVKNRDVVQGILANGPAGHCVSQPDRSPDHGVARDRAHAPRRLPDCDWCLRTREPCGGLVTQSAAPSKVAPLSSALDTPHVRSSPRRTRTSTRTGPARSSSSTRRSHTEAPRAYKRGCLMSGASTAPIRSDATEVGDWDGPKAFHAGPQQRQFVTEIHSRCETRTEVSTHQRRLARLRGPGPALPRRTPGRRHSFRHAPRRNFLQTPTRPNDLGSVPRK